MNGVTKGGMTELLPDVYVNVTDDSDIPHISHLQTPRRQSFIGEDDSCSEIIGKKRSAMENPKRANLKLSFLSYNNFFILIQKPRLGVQLPYSAPIVYMTKTIM